jgi:hypothetical protein
MIIPDRNVERVVSRMTAPSPLIVHRRRWSAPSGGRAHAHTTEPRDDDLDRRILDEEIADGMRPCHSLNEFGRRHLLRVECKADARAVVPDQGGVRVVNHSICVHEINGQPSLATDAMTQITQRAVGQDPSIADHNDTRAEGLDVIHVMRGGHYTR